MKTLPQFRNILMFLVFLSVALLFWFVLALNDSVTETFRVRLIMENVPDSVTFISDPPVDLNVTLRDKGTNILRSGVIKNPRVMIDFRDYARDGIFRMTHTDLGTELKESFGSGVQISSMSLDSLRLYYTTSPGRRVPIVVRAEVTASSGNVISGPAHVLEKNVRVYSFGDQVDTVTHVTTQLLVKRNLKQTSMFDVKINPLKNVKIVPPVVRVRVPVEPLVHKEGYAMIEPRNVPQGESLLLFPNRVLVSYYVPMSMFNETEVPVSVYADYDDTRKSSGNKVEVYVGGMEKFVVNPDIKIDSVEYTLVRK